MLTGVRKPRTSTPRFPPKSTHAAGPWCFGTFKVRLVLGTQNVRVHMSDKPKKIEELTEEQKAMFPVWVDKYTKIGLSCEPADKERAERGIRSHYTVAELEQPRVIVWAAHPMVTVAAGPIASEVLDVIRDRQTTYPQERLHALIQEAVVDNFGSEVEVVVDAVLQGMGYTPDAEAPLEITVDKLREGIRNNWHQVLGGAWWISYVAWATYVRDVLGVEVPIGPREDTDTSCGWWWPHTEFVVVTDRPAYLHRDANGQLHSAAGPAIAWRNGRGMYFWHGTGVPEEWVEHPDQMNPEIALNHPNIEQRRCAAEIMGWDRVLGSLNPIVVDTDPDPQIGVLLEATIGEDRERFLRVVCGTGRTFVLPVPPDMPTALAANAWTYNIEPVDLRTLEART